jgi:hypothetical protein
MKLMLCLLGMLAVMVALPAVAAKPKFLEVCKEEINAFCGDVQPGGGRILRCLDGHTESVSAACKTAMTTSAIRATLAVHSKPEKATDTVSPPVQTGEGH